MLASGSSPTRLRPLLPDAQVFPVSADPVATAVSDDPQTVAPGESYVALDGFDCDGPRHAALRGASAVITERLLPELTCPQLIVEDSWDAHRLLMEKLNRPPQAHDEDAPAPRLITLCGRHENEHTATLIATVLTLAGQPTALRTPHVDDDGEHCHSLSMGHTPSVRDWLIRSAQNHAAYAVLSDTCSHQDTPSVACLAGLARAGHTHAERVHATRATLGELSPATLLVANADDPDCMRLAATHRGPLLTFGEAPHADVRLTATEEHLTGQRVLVSSGKDTAAVDLDRPGSQRRREAAAAFAIATALGLELPPAARALALAPAPSAQLERLTPSSAARVMADAAIAPDHLRETLVSADQLTGGRLIVVANLSDDHSTASGQLAVVEALADRGFAVGGPHDLEFADPSVTSLGDREGAIALAIGLADEGDIVVIAGCTDASQSDESDWVATLLAQRSRHESQRRAA